MPHAFVTAALVGAVLLAGFAPALATPDEDVRPRGGDRFGTATYRPLPPVSGTLRAGRRGLYGDRAYGPVGTRSNGPAVYDLRHRGPACPDGRRARMRRGFADAGPADYAGQGFVPEAASPGYGPVAYDQVAPYGGFASGGYGGGLGFFTQGSYGAGPRVIAIPAHYNVGGRHRGCGCGATGLLGDQTAD